MNILHIDCWFSEMEHILPILEFVLISIKYCSTSLCLVFPWSTRLWARLIVALMSNHKFIGPKAFTHKSSRKNLQQIRSQIHLLIDIESISALEITIISFFLFHQIWRLLPTKIHYTKVDLLLMMEQPNLHLYRHKLYLVVHPHKVPLQNKPSS